MGKFLRNTWYVAAWDDEVSRKLFSRTILGEPILFFRKENGDASAIQDSCPHRFAPLHMGKLIGDAVECGYHGLQFDCTGACVVNPHGNSRIPPSLKVRSYPLAERHNLIWIWMGEAERADTAKIPDFSHLTDPSRKTVRGMMPIEAHYELVVDNLLDASHSQFLHASSLRSDAFAHVQHECFEEGSTVYNRYLRPNERVPRSWSGFIDGPIDRVNHWIEFRWNAPSVLRNRTAIAPVDAGPDKAVEKIGTHILTPETDTTSHYFFGHSRNFKCDDPRIDEQIRSWHRIGFGQEDGPMIEAVQRMIGTHDFNALNPVLFSIDVAAVRARRLLAQMIEEEQKQAVGAERSAPTTAL